MNTQTPRNKKLSGMDIVYRKLRSLQRVIKKRQRHTPFTIQKLYKIYDIPYEEHKPCFSRLNLLCCVAAGFVSATTNINSVVVDAVDALLCISSDSHVTIQPQPPSTICVENSNFNSITTYDDTTI